MFIRKNNSNYCMNNLTPYAYIHHNSFFLSNLFHNPSIRIVDVVVPELPSCSDLDWDTAKLLAVGQAESWAGS